ncbi:hypothetical protein FKR81_30505 [Lentzea tibetensis]|uniref:Uncharacterized protein n=1 Tax=Lentzea tibetensis TaxID=2591470 RepID=A0A563ELG9_9PSEU|nr:hypothetical protein [Lentzea tibetensis]TWP47998.1 hypothetical protein FKR81_30505 [Lentzea tibetensis]
MTGPFHVVLREAIQQRGLPLDRLRSRLAQRGIRVGLATLSDWQHGNSRPQRPNSMRAVDALEEILGLPHGTLTGLLAPGGIPRHGVDEHSGPLGELLGSLPRGHAWDLETITTETTYAIGPDRRRSGMSIRKLVRARRDGVDRARVCYFGASEGVIGDADVRPVRNCGLGEVRRHAGGNVLVAEVLFGQSLRTGETWLFEYAVDQSETTTDVAHAIRQPEGNWVLEVRFHPDALPAVVHGYYRADLYGDRQRVSELPLTNHHSVLLTSAGMSAGVVGINWRWL